MSHLPPNRYDDDDSDDFRPPHPSQNQANPNQYHYEPYGSSRDDLHFQPPELVHSSYETGRRQTLNYMPASEEYYNRPENIFTAPDPPHQHYQNERSYSTQQLNGNPFQDEYELHNYPEYQPYHAENMARDEFEDAFVPNFYRDGDEDEQEFDRNIQFDGIEGDHYDLHPVEIPVQEEYRGGGDDGLDRGDLVEFGEEMENPPDLEEVRQPPPKIGLAGGLQGNLVLDCPVATELLSKFPDYNPEIKSGGLAREFAFMRYTAVTCGPLNFKNKGFILRPVHYQVKRRTELLVCITMYNEDEILLARTLKGVFKNIKYLESRTRSNTWGKDSWKKVVVCVVADGRSKINERAQALLAGLGVYQEGLAKSKVDDDDVKAHIYEYTTRVGISLVEDTVKLTTQKIVPVQMLFCLKEKNAKKINSHRWCFQAVCDTLDPRIVVLLDAGTQPSGKSLYHLWKEFDNDETVAGACGEIKASLKKHQVLTNPLVYAQNFEYKISNILDKPTESVFGFISVLPGAFSAYRYLALQNDMNGKGPLEKYFKGEFLHGSGVIDEHDDERALKLKQAEGNAGIFTSNMYLAEDRILCFELVAKPNCNWVLRYCKAASAETDVPEGLAEFILQRRRWLNGSFFAAIYALAHFPQVWKSGHSIGKQFWLHVEFFYQFLNLVVSWFSLALYFLVFRILTTSLAASDLHFAPGKVLLVVLLWLYLASIVTTFVLSFGNKPKGTEKFYIVIVVFFAILMAYMIFAAIFMAVHAIQDIRSETAFTVTTFFKNEEFRDLVVLVALTYVLYFLALFMYFEPWHMFTSFAQYILLSPAYVNVLNIYAFCNIDDVSWGTKGDTGAKDLGVAKKNEQGMFDVDIPVLEEEVNQSYLNQIEKIRSPLVEEKKEEKISNEDYYAFVRSMTVLVWMFLNFVIIALVLETGGVNDLTSHNSDSDRSNRSRIFLTVILWTVAFMALFRFIGCLVYLVQRGIRRIKSRGNETRVKVNYAAVH